MSGCSKCRCSEGGCSKCRAALPTQVTPEPDDEDDGVEEEAEVEEVREVEGKEDLCHGAGSRLPEGWREERRKAAARDYSVYYGPNGEYAESVAQAWRGGRRKRSAAPLAAPPPRAAAAAAGASPAAATAYAPAGATAQIWADGARGTGYEICHGSCFDALQQIQAGSVSVTIIDPPYGARTNDLPSSQHTPRALPVPTSLHTHKT